eukprot:5825978-Amphidinium_carterae.1
MAHFCVHVMRCTSIQKTGKHGKRWLPGSKLRIHASADDAEQHAPNGAANETKHTGAAELCIPNTSVKVKLLAAYLATKGGQISCHSECLATIFPKTILRLSVQALSKSSDVAGNQLSTFS